MNKIKIFFLALILFTYPLSYLTAQNWNFAPIPGQGGGSFFEEALSSLDRAFNDNSFTPEEAYYLGRTVAANILSIYRPYTGNPELTRYLNKIALSIAINSSQPIFFDGYHVIILDSQEINAFASPGGHIFLTRGLIEACNSEDMLAAVIAHEMAHIMLRHGLAIIENMGISFEMENMASRAAALSGNSLRAQQLTLIRNSVNASMNALIISGYSQPQEFEADLEAINLLAASGYNTGAMLELLLVLQSIQSRQRGGYFTTHPTPALRITNVQSALINHRTDNNSNTRIPRFDRYTKP